MEPSPGSYQLEKESQVRNDCVSPEVGGELGNLSYLTVLVLGVEGLKLQRGLPASFHPDFTVRGTGV